MAATGSWFELQPATSGDGGADLPRPLQAMRARLGQRRAPRRFEPFVTTSYWTECLSGKTASQRVSDETWATGGRCGTLGVVTLDVKGRAK
jgi:hypothetical protein